MAAGRSIRGNAATRFGMLISTMAVVAITPAAEGQCERAKLLDAEGQGGDHLGCTVAVSGDVSVVGAPDHGLGGCVIVYRLYGSGWGEEARLTASDAAVGDDFGCAVAISGDRILIGAEYDDSPGNNWGSAYVFRHNGEVWFEEEKLIGSAPQAGDQFGHSVSISADVAVVGSFRDDDDTGSADVYRFDGDEWVHEGKLTASDAAPADQFGWSVAVYGEALIIGARLDDDNGDAAGSAYVFRYDNGQWAEEAKLLAPDGAEGDQFGCSVDLAENRLIVGAQESDAVETNAGAAYLFEYAGGVQWFPEAELTASDAMLGDRFGTSVSIHLDTVLVGAYAGDAGQSDCGAAYLIRDQGPVGWVEEARFTASDASMGDHFGGAVDISDAIATIGAEYNDDHGTSSGSAYLFELYGEDCNDNGICDDRDIAEGFSADCNGNGIPDECEGLFCDGDVNLDCIVNVLDLLAVIGAWGAAGGPEDVNGDGIVDVLDLLVVIGAWGPC